jgi:hypothetical protein
MSGASFNLPPLINIIEASSKAPRISSNCTKLDDIFLRWNKSSFDSGYKSLSKANNSPILSQSRSLKTRYVSPVTSSNNLGSSSPYSYNDSMFSLPIRKHSAISNSSRVNLYTPPSSPAYSPTRYSPSSSSSSNGQNVKKSRMNFSKSITKILKDWIYANVSHPFPNDIEKAELSTATGLSIEQINNWFINGRRRLLVVKKTNNNTKYYKI